MDITQEQWIRQRAYAIWEEEGRPHGQEWNHWFRAAGEAQPPAGAATPSETAAATPGRHKGPATRKRTREPRKKVV
jgi:hypothetical protein